MKDFFRALRGLPPPYSGTHGGTAARGAPRRANHALLPPFSSLLSTQRVPTHYPLHSSPYSLHNGSPLHSDHALPSPFSSLPSTPDGSPLHSGHALPSPFSSLLSTLYNLS